MKRNSDSISIDQEDRREKIRDGLVSTRDREIERYENIMYSVASGCIALALGIGSFCYSYGISLLSLKWLLLAVFGSSGFAIIALLASDKAGILSREYGVEAMDISDPSRRKECSKKSEKWDAKTGLLNKIAMWSFAVGVALTMVALVWLMVVMPAQKPEQNNKEDIMQEPSKVPAMPVPEKIAEDGKPLLPREKAEIQKPVSSKDNSVVVLDSKGGR